MEKLNATFIIKQAREKLAGKDAARLAAIHTGVTVAAALVITLLQYVLAEGIGNTSGLSGLGTRSILETLQTVLQWANMILLPFWGLGFLHAALQWVRDKYARKEDLLMGFRRIGPYLGLMINRALLTIGVMLLCANVSSMAYMMTPAAAQLADLAASAADMEAMYEILEQLSQTQITELLYAMLPMLVLWGVLSLLLLVPLMYRFRLAEYVILDETGARGLSSMLISAALLRRRCWQLFKVDLRLWWYYGLKALCTLLYYGDVLLGMMGVTLPIGSDGAYFATYILYLAALFAVETRFRPQVEAAYACVYEACKEMGPVQKKVTPKPRNMPWDAQ